MRVATRPDNPIEAVGLLAGMAPEPLFEGYFGLMASRVLMAGSRLGIFDALAERPDDAAGLAKRIDCDEAGVDAMLVALHSMDYLDLSDGLFEPSKKARRHLTPDAEQPLREVNGSFAYDMWEFFSRLEDTVRGGEPVVLHDGDADDPWWDRYMRGLFELSELRSGDLVKMIPADSPRRLLDLAGGHGGYSVAMCRRHEGLTARVIELEGAARVGRDLVAEAGYSDRIEFEVADMFEAEFQPDHDVVMANSILHHFDADTNVRLLKQGLAALRPGGTMAVIEQERPPQGNRGSQLGGLTGVLFYVTSKARTWTADELTGLFERAGFDDVKARRSTMVPGIVVITGTKPGKEQT